MTGGVNRSAMKLAISNIAWPLEDERTALGRLAGWGCQGIELAASKVWPEPLDADAGERSGYRRLVEDRGLSIVSLHALLYTRPDLRLFADPDTSRKTVAYLQDTCRLAADLGASVLVFGSPANRRLNGLDPGLARDRAAEYFGAIGRVARDLGVCFCVEPLGASENEFITTLGEAMELVDLVGSRGFGLHLDSKALFEQGGDLEPVLAAARDRVSHVHISEPNLGPIGWSGSVDHAWLGRKLREQSYGGYASIEMRTQPGHMEVIESCIATARKLYLGA